MGTNYGIIFMTFSQTISKLWLLQSRLHQGSTLRFQYRVKPLRVSLSNVLSSFVKDEMVWKLFFSAILMYIIGWRCGLLAAPTPMTPPQSCESSQNGYFEHFLATPSTLRLISEKFSHYKKCSYCTGWWSYVIRTPPGGFWGKWIFHPIPPLTAHCVMRFLIWLSPALIYLN